MSAGRLARLSAGLSALYSVSRAQVRYWRGHRLQVALCLVGMVLGVAVYVAIQLANRAALEAFDDAVDAFAGRATHRIYHPAGGTVPEALYPRIAALARPEVATPVLQGWVETVAAEPPVPPLPGLPTAGLPVQDLPAHGLPVLAKPGLGLTVLGLEPLSDGRFRRFDLLGAETAAQARGDATGSSLGSSMDASTGAGRNDSAPGARTLEDLLTRPNAALLPRSLAGELGLRVGDTLAVRGRAGKARLYVAGVFDPPRRSARSLSRTLVMDMAAYQETFGRVGTLDAIHLLLPDSQPGGLDEILRAALPPQLALEAIGGRSRRVEHMSQAFRLNLEVLGLFALLVGMFLIFNAALFSVVQRRHHTAILRCLGAGRGLIFSALLGEAVLLGALAALGGVGVGLALGGAMLRNTGATLFEVLLLSHPLPAAVRLDSATWLTALALGVGVSALGALYPAWRAARVSPLAAVRGERHTAGGRSNLGVPLLLAVVGFGAAALLYALPTRSLAAGLALALALALGGAALCPLLLAATGPLLAAPLSVLAGARGRLAARNLARSVSRNGMAAASLMVALALALSIEITVRSFKHTFEVWLSQVLSADVYLRPGPGDSDGAASPAGPVFTPAHMEQLRRLPFTAHLAALRTRTVVLGNLAGSGERAGLGEAARGPAASDGAAESPAPEGREALALALDIPAYERRNAMPVRDIEPGEAIAGLRRGGVMLSEALAWALHLQRGDTLRIPTEAGPQPFEVVAIVQNYSAPGGVLYLEWEVYGRTFGPGPPESVGLWLKPGHTLAEALPVLEALPFGNRLRLAPNAEIRGGALEVFDRTFRITDLMGSLAALVAFIAVVSALTALLEERRRLLGVLRAIGVSRRGLALALGLEAGLLAVVATVAAWGTGVAISAVLVYVVNPRAFGWSLQFLPEQGGYLKLLALALAAALLGAAWPIHKATRLSISATIRDE